MNMDELIRAIEKVDTENAQDVVDALRKRYEQLYPNLTLVMLALPKNDPNCWMNKITEALRLEEKMQETGKLKSTAECFSGAF